MNRSGVRVPKKAHKQQLADKINMLMFDNGIFTSFIPQILMVLGYFSCLVAPKFFAEKNTIVFEATEINITTIQEPVISEKTAFYFEFNVDAELVEFAVPIIVFYGQYISEKIPDKHIFFDKVLLFCRFSRPPPIQLS